MGAEERRARGGGGGAPMGRPHPRPPQSDSPPKKAKKQSAVQLAETCVQGAAEVGWRLVNVARLLEVWKGTRHKAELSGYGVGCFTKKTALFVFFGFFCRFLPFLAVGWCFFMFFGVFLFFHGGIRYKHILWYQGTIVF